MRLVLKFLASFLTLHEIYVQPRKLAASCWRVRSLWCVLSFDREHHETMLHLLMSFFLILQLGMHHIYIIYVTNVIQ